jgi:hypothetical protein
MRTYDDTFSGEKIYPGKVRISSARDDEVAKNDRRVWQNEAMRHWVTGKMEC